MQVYDFGGLTSDFCLNLPDGRPLLHRPWTVARCLQRISALLACLSLGLLWFWGLGKTGCE
jgi:hypothetical protein